MSPDWARDSASAAFRPWCCSPMAGKSPDRAGRSRMPTRSCAGSAVSYRAERGGPGLSGPRRTNSVLHCRSGSEHVGVSMARVLLMMVLAAAAHSAQAADDLKVSQLEQDVRDLQRQVQALSR